MARRRNERIDDDGLRSDRKDRSRPKRKPRKRSILLWGILAVMLIGIIVLPRIVVSRSILLPLIDRYAGIAPLKVDFTRVTAGWFTPVSVDGLQLIDSQGQLVARVGNVTTEKGLVSWITSSSNLGTIHISDVDVAITAHQSTTNVEQAVAPLMGEAPAAESKKASKPQGTIDVKNVRVLLARSSGNERYLVEIPTFRTQLPGPDQLIGPTQLSASIGAMSAAAAGTVQPNAAQPGIAQPGAPTVAEAGSIAADVAEITNESGRSFTVRAQLDRVPLGFWQIIRERMPSLPIDDLKGTVSGRMAGSIAGMDRWTFNVEQFNADGLTVTAPSIVGSKPAALNLVQFKGQATLNQGRLLVDGSQLATDFGSVSASGNLPWPPPIPTLASPWIPGSQFNAQGSVDLAKLAQAAESLIPMRDDTRLVKGSAQFKADQQLNASGQPNMNMTLELSDLQAVAQGQNLAWDQPFKLAATAVPQADGQVALKGTCNAEFLNAAAEVNSQAGSLQAVVDLDRLQHRLSQWFTLPIETMKGNAELSVAWNQPAAGKVDAQGTLKTSPLEMALAGGGKLREPAWNGKFTAAGSINGGTLQAVDRAHVELTAQNEKLQLDVLEPLVLVAQASTVVAPASSTTPAATTNRAAYTLSASGSLDLWKQRAVMLKLLDPSMDLRGNYTLGASGRVAIDRLEVEQANWESKPFMAGTSSFRLAEEQMIGKFQGRVDTSDLTRLAVEQLTVQAGSFALSAADAAAADGSGSRDGRGAFIVDLNRLMKNVQSSPQVATNLGQAPTSELQYAGQMQGDLVWRVSSKAASVSLKAVGEQIDVLSVARGSAPQRLWNEPKITSEVKAAWDATTGNINVEQMVVQSPWMSYAGTASLENKTDSQVIRADGKCLYDAAQVAAKLQPYIGNQVQMVGQKTVPVEVLWNRSNDSTQSMFAGLQASTRIGWQQARVVGIDVGEADVPVRIQSGQLTTAAEIPVSGGTVRWDVHSDLTAPQLVIHQKPMTVLENVAITPQMCQSWLKYVTPLLAEATSVDGRLSLQVNEARLNPANPRDQTVDGVLLIQSANVGPGPLSNQVLGLVQQVNAIRHKQLATAVSSQQVWLQMPQQNLAFRMENGRVMHKNLTFKAGDVNISSSGAVDIDGRIELATAMPIPDDWIEKSPWLAGFRGQTLQFPVGGTLTAPRVDTQLLGSLSQGMAQQAVQGALQQGLSRGLNKLFGAPLAAPATQPVTPP
ncbi:MAG: hypothetical protein U0892_03935 [Pirellulales bacterium]